LFQTFFQLIRLLNIINEQNEHEELGQAFDPCDKLQQSFKVIKEGFLEKKGSYTASQWHKYVDRNRDYAKKMTWQDYNEIKPRWLDSTESLETRILSVLR